MHPTIIINFTLWSCIILTSSTYALPVDQPLPPTPPVSEIDFFENVTIPTCSTLDDVASIKNGLIDKRYRWKIFNVQPGPAYNEQERQAINDAMYRLQEVLPCVKFGLWPSDATPTGDYIRIVRGTSNGCSSFIGRLGNGKQQMNLQSPGCMSKGTIMHEMIHALGFHHEQNRANRDDYVEVLLQNVQPGRESQFRKLDKGQATAFGVAYNQQSIMHYGGKAFSKNGNPTIKAKNGKPLGSQGVLKQSDINKLRKMYEC